MDERLEILHYFIDKEREFMKQFKPAFEDIYNRLNYPLEVNNIKDVDQMWLACTKCFALSLLEDEDFLQREVLEHFYHSEENLHIFCISLFEEHEPCTQCGEIHSEWFALYIDIDEQLIGYGHCDCYTAERVSDSSYRGNTFHEVKALVDKYFIKDKEVE